MIEFIGKIRSSKNSKKNSEQFYITIPKELLDGKKLEASKYYSVVLTEVQA
jgi:hypothetical protein